MTAPGLYPEHDIFIQLMKLKNTLRWMRGEDMITHLGLEYYDPGRGGDSRQGQMKRAARPGRHLA